ncbi:hypothetical protein E2C01_068530 [Portunus trituberculatus]|uniref:Uncharacterized protein n=1 Tax=Portunus trituberculatus TaxID=210409 RepID=A0A5B7HP23_PORTR|nr:hypothetical protein [Portunus trituberculatus]
MKESITDHIPKPPDGKSGKGVTKSTSRPSVEVLVGEPSLPAQESEHRCLKKRNVTQTGYGPLKISQATELSYNLFPEARVGGRPVLPVSHAAIAHQPAKVLKKKCNIPPRLGNDNHSAGVMASKTLVDASFSGGVETLPW